MTRSAKHTLSSRHLLFAGLAAAALVGASPVQAQTNQVVNIPAGSLDGALRALAAQTHQQLMFPPGLVAGRKASALSGAFTPEQAAARLINSSDITVTRAGPAVLVLRAAEVSASAPAEEARGAVATHPIEGDPVPAPRDPPKTLRIAPTTSPSAPTTVSEVEVTGTHLRGVADGPSPVVSLNRDDLDRTGYATIADALNTLPQVFGGQATEGTLTNSEDRSGLNTTYATGINLRGLGTNATLVLVNGRRMAGAGALGNFSDLSTIPTSAVQRVDVLLDGASAIYGSDAVGGVVNIILRKDFDGAETRLLGGEATDGQPAEVQASQIFGRRWSDGGFLVSYEYEHRDALPGSARDFTASADLRSLGGTDHRLAAGFPGNILLLNPATQASVAAFAIPSGQNGVGLTPGAFLPGVVNLGDQRLAIDTLPDQTRHSIYVAGHQDLGDRLEISGDARWGYRTFSLETGYPLTVLSVTHANPFYVSPVGAASESIEYSLMGDVPVSHLGGSEESLGGTFGGTFKLARDWQLDGYATFAEEIGVVTSTQQLNSALLNEALGTVPDNPATAFSTAANGFFNPFTGIAHSNSTTVTNFIDSGFTNSRTRDEVASVSLQADGTLFSLPGGPLKVALGVQARREGFVRTGSNFVSTATPVTTAPTDVSRSVVAGFAELRAPLVTDDNAVPGVQRLELSLAGRVEHYDDFGTTSNPKVGALWSPLEGVLVRASYGTSFRAPDLRELHDPEVISTSLLPLGNARVVSLVLTGGNPTLKPETATSWTAGIDWSPPSLPGFKVSGDWFDIDFSSRIAQPARTGLANALTDPTLTSFVQRLSPATNATDLATIAALLASPAAGASSFAAQSYGAIIDARYVNTAALEVRGIDLNGSYRTTWRGDTLGASLNASYLYNYIQQLTPTGVSTDEIGIANFPVKLRARATGDWARGPWSALVAVNFTDGLKAPTGANISSQTTVDAQVSLTAAADSPWRGFKATFNVRNLFNVAPPFYDSPQAIGYDAANYDPIGRFVSLQITKAW